MNVKTRGVFCPECRNNVTYTVTEKELTHKFKGSNKIYKYLGKMACCDNCKEELFINEIVDENLNSLYDEYRKQNNLVSQDIINEIPNKYNMLNPNNIKSYTEDMFNKIN